MPSILIVESELEFERLLENGLKKYFSPQIYYATTSHRAVAYIKTFILDLIVANVDLESGSGFDILGFLADSHSSIPLILCSRDADLDVSWVKYPHFLGLVHEADFDGLIELIRHFQDSTLMKAKQGEARKKLEGYFSSRVMEDRLGRELLTLDSRRL